MGPEDACGLPQEMPRIEDMLQHVQADHHREFLIRKGQLRCVKVNACGDAINSHDGVPLGLQQVC
jgi:hypothetical protein